MSLRKKYRYTLLFLLLLPALGILGEFIFFLKMTHSDPVLQKADLIAVFTGEEGRVEEGFRLANRGYSSHLVISRASSQVLERYQRELKTATTFDCIVEEESRTIHD